MWRLLESIMPTNRMKLTDILLIVGLRVFAQS